MALWMEEGAAPLTDNERADLDAIAAIKELTAFELKEKGNQFVKMGRKHYTDAIDCYTRAINQRSLSDSENSLLFSNRAHVNLLLGNYKRALLDSEEAINLCSANIKAFYRAVKASLSLNLLDNAASFCKHGLELAPSNEELKKLAKEVNLRKVEAENRDAEVMKAISAAKDLASAFESRGLKLGKGMFRELIGVRKPVLDDNNILHWPVLLLYPEDSFKCQTYFQKTVRHYHGIMMVSIHVEILSYIMRPVLDQSFQKEGFIHTFWRELQASSLLTRCANRMTRIPLPTKPYLQIINLVSGPRWMRKKRCMLSCSSQTTLFLKFQYSTLFRANLHSIRNLKQESGYYHKPSSRSFQLYCRLSACLFYIFA